MILYLGSKNYSSWSLRAWLALKQTGLPFEEVVIPLDQPGTHDEILRISPSGKVPALRDGDLLIWDSLAIGEYLAEKYPPLWPETREARAVARTVTCEMHSGFQALRQNMPMNIRKSAPGTGRAEGVDADIARVVAIWHECRNKYGLGGPFLFGRFTVADCFFAPVVSRFHTYGVEVDEIARAYMDAVWSHPSMQAWVQAAKSESHVAARYEK